MTATLLTIATIGTTLATIGALAMTGGAPPERRSPSLEIPTAVDTEDVDTIDGILAAVYDCISGPAGQPRQWARFRGLMHPEAARLMAVQPTAEGGERLLTLTVDAYIELTDQQFTSKGFFERELHRRVERFGHVAHVWSTFALRQDEDGDDQRRGVNSYQLFHDGERWWVTSILWDGERDDQPIPAEFLPG